jgi:hypothetical protein
MRQILSSSSKLSVYILFAPERHVDPLPLLGLHVAYEPMANVFRDDQ